MQMHVHDDLVAVGAGIHDEAVAAFNNALFGSELRDDGEHAASHGGVIRRKVICAGEVIIGDDEDMGGCKGIDIPKGGDPLVLKDLIRGDLAGDDLTENAVLVSHSY